MKDADILALLAQAEAHFQYYRWDEALACFEQVLQAAPQHPGARDGVRKTQRKKQVEANMAEAIGEAREALQTRRYELALNALARAQTLGADETILNHHAEIQGLREDIQQQVQWQKRVADALKKAKAQEQDKAPHQALETLETLLRELASSGLEELGERAGQERDRLQSAMDLDDRIEAASKAYDAQDYERAALLSAALRNDYPDDHSIKRRYEHYYATWQDFRDRLDQAREALSENRLDDAVALLNKLRDEAPNNPAWQALWLKAFTEHGRSLMEAGRQAFPRGDFAAAHEAFRQADASAFARVLEIFPDHPSATQSAAEARALAECVQHSEEASNQARQLHWDAARAAQRSARQKRQEAAEVRNDPFGEIEAVLQAKSGELDEKARRWDEAQVALQEGQGSLKARDLRRAADAFRRGLQALSTLEDDALRGELTRGLQEAEQRRSDVERLLATARDEKGKAALDRLRTAYKRWPTAPGMPDLLAQQLVDQARQALNNQQKTDAAAWCNEAAGLAGVSPDLLENAHAILQSIGCQDAVAGILAEADRLLDQEQRQPRPTLAGYRQIVDLLQRGRSAAQACPELLAPLDERLAPVQERNKRLEKAEPLLAKAEAQRQSGDWSQAARIQEQAIKALGDLATEEERDQVGRWQEIAGAVSQAQEQAGSALKAAREEFKRLVNGDLAAINWDELRRQLSQGERILAAPPAGAEPLPARWQELREAGKELGLRADVVQRAHGSVLAGAPDLSELIAVAGQDAKDTAVTTALRSLRAQSKDLLKGQAEQFLAAAREHAERGEWTEALEQLAAARAVGAESADVQTEIKQLERRSAVWQKVRSLTEEGLLKSRGNSEREALDAFRDALRFALSPDSTLPETTRQHLSTLLGLEDRLNVEESYQEASQHRSHLIAVEAGYNHLVQTYLVVPVDRWFELAGRRARTKVIDSAMSLGQHQEAYRAAKQSIKQNPDDQYAVTQATKAREEIKAQLVKSVSKRIDWAQELQTKGSFEEAIVELEKIDIDFIRPIKEEFPEITGGDSDLENLEKRRIDLRVDLNQLIKRNEQLQPLLQTARASLIDKNWDSAQQALDEAQRLDESHAVVPVWQELIGLERLIARNRDEDMRKTVRARLTATRILLSGAAGEEQVRNAVIDLDELRDAVDRLKDEGLSTDYRSQLAALGAWLQDHGGLTQELATAEERGKAGAIEEQFEALKRAKSLAKGKELAAIEAQLTRLHPSVQRERQRQAALDAAQAAWDAAHLAFAGEKWLEAQTQFEQAKKLGINDPVLPHYQQATRAAIRLRSIEALIKNAPEEAQVELQQVQRMVQGCVPAEGIGLPERIQNYLEIVDIRLKHQEAESRRRATERSELEGWLRDAQAALRGQKFDAARQKLNQILEREPKHAEALPLVQVIEAEEMRHRGDYRAALTQISGILEQYPNSLEAKALQAQLQAEVEPGEALARARSLADNKKFADAQAELTRARDLNPHHPRLAETQTYVQEQEDRFRDRALGPAGAALRRQDYRSALQEYQILLTQAGAPDFKAEIETLRQNAVNEWAERQEQTAQIELKKADLTADDLVKQRNALQEILGTLPGPSAQRKQALQEMVRRIEIRRLRQRLETGRTALEKEQIEDAQVIADELEREAKEIGDFKLTRDVGEFGLAIVQRQTARFKQRRNEILMQARQELERASDPQQLEVAQRLAGEALKLPGFTQDAEALRIQREAREEEDRYEDTSRALTTVLQRLRTAWYRGARQTLDEMQDISRLLAPRVNELSDLQRQLQSAADLESGDPHTALTVYTAALATAAKPAYRLGDTVQAAISRCTTQLGEQTLERAKQHLEGTVPDHQKAQAELNSAISQGWLNEQDGQVTALRKRIGGLALTASAIRALVEERSAAGALALFQQAHDQAPGGELDALSAGWEIVARAQSALESDDLDQARNALAATPELLLSEPTVVRLQAGLTAREQVAQTVKAARNQAEAALLGDAPDYQTAIQAARTALAAATPATDAAQTVAALVLGRLQTEAEELRRQERYQDASTFVDRMKQLDLQKAAALGGEFEQERVRLLDETIEKAELALSQDNLAQAEQHAARVKRLTDARADGRAAFLAQRIQQRREELQTVDEALRAARTAMQPDGANWVNAVKQARAAEALAPRYDSVHQVINELRGRLNDEIERNRSTGNYPQALVCTDLALELGRDDALTLARGQILAEQSKRANAEYQEAQRALAVFDLERAEEAHAAGLRANSQDMRFAALTERLRRARELAPKLKQALESCWTRLQQRDFEQAAAALQGFGDVGEFVELRAWQRYISGLMDGIQLVSAEKRAMAAHYFAEAEKSLRVNPQETLSPLWGERLREERREAVYYAWRLRQQAGDMERDVEKYKTLREKGDLLNASSVLSAVITRTREFPDFVKGRSVAPPSFDATAAGFVQSSAGVVAAATQTSASFAPAAPPARIQPVAEPESAPASQPPPESALPVQGAEKPPAVGVGIVEEDEPFSFSFDPDETAPEPESVPPPPGDDPAPVAADPVVLDDWDSWWSDSPPAADQEPGA